jgi:hypothetical protein
VKKGDPPVMGITKVGMNGITEAELKRPRKKIGIEETTTRLPSTTPGSLPEYATEVSRISAATANSPGA